MITKMATDNKDLDHGASDDEMDSIENETQKPSYDPENAKPIGDKDEKKTKGEGPINLALPPILLLLLALQVSLLLSKYIIYGDDGMPAAVSLIAGMTLGIVAMVVLFQQIWAGKVHLRGNMRQNAQVNSILRDNLSLVGIIFFCPFACLLDIFQLFTEISCGLSPRMTKDYRFFITDTAFCVLHIVFMTLELLFCVQFRRLALSKEVSRFRGLCVKLSLTVVVAANIGLWFNVILEETTNEDTDLSTAQSPENNSYQFCLQGTSNSQEEPIRRSLYPFSVEFSLLVLEFFCSHLIFNRQHNDHEEEEEVQEEVEPTSEVLSPSLHSLSGSRQSLVFGVTSPLVILFGVFSNLVSVTLAFFSRENIFGIDILHATIVNNQQFLVFYWLLLIVLMAIGFASAYKFQVSKSKLKGIDYVVMASAFGPFICFLIRVIVVWENLDTVYDQYDVTIIWLPEIINLFQILIQLPFMFFADGVQKPSEEETRKPRWRIFKAAVLSLALSNITQWLLDSVLLDLDLVATIFSTSSWTIVDGIFRPFSIFFRFNSFLILLRVFLR